MELKFVYLLHLGVDGPNVNFLFQNNLASNLNILVLGVH